MPRLPVILNPSAGRGSAGEREDELHRALRRYDIQPKIFRTQSPEEAQETARGLCARGEAVVAAAGGDGTLHVIAQALVGARTALGVLPMGSGNDFARAVGIPPDLSKAVEVLCRGKARPVDVGVANGVFYLNSLGMGIDGQIAHHYRTHRFLKGEAGYLLATAYEALRFRPVAMEVQADNLRFFGDCLMVSVMNGPWAGGGFCLAPGAQPDDGLLDLALIGHYPRLVRLLVLPKTRDGSHLRLRRTIRVPVRRARVRAERALFVHADGELFPERTALLEVELVPGAVNVVA